jgi:rhamnogalacturonyl hydrolase YesR
MAASEQLRYLVKVAPRARNGAISHRVDQVQLWSDFLYMAPPFIAYYGALQCNWLLQEAYEQVKLYRDILFDAEAGLWRHIMLGKGEDPTHWGTGNGWAVAGMLRVLETVKQSCAADSMRSQQTDLVRWVSKTLDGVWKYQVRAFSCLLTFFQSKKRIPPFRKKTAHF